MSLRILTGLLVAAAVIMVPVTNALLLQWWPPPDFAVHLKACSDEANDGPCVPPELFERRFGRALPSPPLAESEDAGVRAAPDAAPRLEVAGEVLAAGKIARGVGSGGVVASFGPGPGPGPFVRTIRFGGPDATPVRRHFLMINLISLALVVGVAVALMSLMLSRPFRALLAAIGDIERGTVPPAWAFTGPVEFRRVGHALEKLGHQLRSNLQERELMLAGLSHDLRSPLARIQAALELRSVDGENWSDTLRDVREIDHIVGQCIDFARDGQDEPVQNASVDSVVTAVLGAEAGTDLRLEPGAPQPLPLRIAALRRALRNLVDNARLHGRAPIVVRTNRSDGDAVICVEDAGNGIAAEAWDRLRRPFARGSSARSPGGCGLGLAIVQRVADMHGGCLRLRPVTDGQPFAIELRLPIKSA